LTSETIHYDAGDSNQVEKRKTKAQLQREREIAEVHQILSSKSGRAFMWRALEQAGFHKLSFEGEATHQTAFNEGRRSIANWLLSEALTAMPQCYNLMRDEALSREFPGKD
jgi:hypothetical protein